MDTKQQVNISLGDFRSAMFFSGEHAKDNALKLATCLADGNDFATIDAGNGGENVFADIAMCETKIIVFGEIKLGFKSQLLDKAVLEHYGIVIAYGDFYALRKQERKLFRHCESQDVFDIPDEELSVFKNDVLFLIDLWNKAGAEITVTKYPTLQENVLASVFAFHDIPYGENRNA